MSDSSLSERPSLESLRSHASSNSVQSQPDTLPPAVTGRLAWEGSELAPEEYVVELETDEIENIRAAVISFKLLGLPRSRIDKETFPLQLGLVNKLASLSKEIHNGRGVVVVRGLHAAGFNDEEAVIAFAGVSSHVCPERATDSFADQTLSHIRDATQDKVPDWARELGLAGSKLPTAMEFHADRFSGDVLALYVRNDGSSVGGGEQFIASFCRIYNELLDVAPDALETLAAPNWPFELKHPVHKQPYLELGPAMFLAGGKPICQLVKAPLLGSPKIPRSKSMPPLSIDQIYALEVVEGLARRFGTKLDRRNGDIQFIHNLSIMHARSAYGTKPSQGRSGRHLLRMFLRDPKNAWSKPYGYLPKFEDPFAIGREQNLPILDMDPWRKITGRESHG
ncbi:Clavaminate synthase-like protein [Mytilinidion resinicola]|uniref:Clavaminate synthase-like protein n=1 Tax=Mytilinidion resinicola TaxID=574789 RepID=A0A6A6YK22_9PEZI|nr:Clavaminate synthase-like protein [Mytilinidion resinicola]KAF2808899.1 Clavaminate synthase-like protein [Mytilinidion resinicola]